MPKIFISTYPFSRSEKTPLRLLESSGYEYTINPFDRKLKPEEVKELAKDADAIVAGTEDLTSLVESSQNLKIIARVGIGLDSVPLDLCKEKGITVCYTPDAVTPAVAELTVGLMLDTIRRISFADRELRNKKWSRPYGRRIGTSKIGLIGFGRVGSMVAELLSGFRPQEILVNDIVDISEKVQKLKNKGLPIRETDKSEIYENCDIISLHLPRTVETTNLISTQEFSLMKKTSILINTSRGGIINEECLYTVLSNHSISGAAIDVFEDEPYQGKMIKLENIVLTQHMGSCSEDCRADMEREAVEDVLRFFRGEQVKSKV
jgi:D-3-phosphoglycerate dehydrogenase